MLKKHFGLLAALTPAMFLGGCFESSTSSTDDVTETSGIYAAVTDYSSYAVQSVGDTSAVTLSGDYSTAAGGGLALSSADGILYVMNQATGVLQALKSGSVILEKSVGASSDPCQVVKAGEKLYVIRYLSNNVLILNTSLDSIGAIDLSKSANSEGNVHPAKAAFISGKLWVLAQRTTSSYTYDSGMVIIADTGASSTAPRGVAMPTVNPMGIAVLGSSVYVASHGGYGTDADAGYELFDLSGNYVKNLSKISTGRPSALVVAGGQLWAISNGAWPAATVVSISASGAEGTSLSGPAAAIDLATDGTHLWVADRASGDAHGVWKFNASTGAKSSYVKTSLPPSSLALVK